MTFDDRYGRESSSAPTASNAPYTVHRPFEQAANSQFITSYSRIGPDQEEEEIQEEELYGSYPTSHSQMD